MQQISILQKIFSYIIPIRLRRSSGKDTPFLELLFYRGQYQLATEDALYSDGNRYTPLKVAFKHIGNDLANVKSVLMLGTGLASGVQILSKKGYYPNYTLVEYDNTILKWAIELLPNVHQQIQPVCADAQHFMKGNTLKYDIVIVDIFNSRIVPSFVITQEFMLQCKDAINDKGYLVFNYIVQSNEDWQPVDQLLRNVFAQCYCIDNDLNRIVIARV